MKKMTGLAAAAAVVLTGLAMSGKVQAAEQASQADKIFVSKVSQGGLYEVEAGKVAEAKGTLPVIKDFGALEVQDHEAVNAKLKSIASATGAAGEIKPGLNPEFSARLAKLKATPEDQFDSYYVADMKQIHNNDEGLFATEAEDGSPAYKTFAHNTAVLVKAHLGWLNTL